MKASLERYFQIERKSWFKCPDSLEMFSFNLSFEFEVNSVDKFDSNLRTENKKFDVSII